MTKRELNENRRVLKGYLRKIEKRYEECKETDDYIGIVRMKEIAESTIEFAKSLGILQGIEVIHYTTCIMRYGEFDKVIRNI